jgi:hypothetical protein
LRSSAADHGDVIEGAPAVPGADSHVISVKALVIECVEAGRSVVNHTSRRRKVSAVAGLKPRRHNKRPPAVHAGLKPRRHTTTTSAARGAQW